VAFDVAGTMAERFDLSLVLMCFNQQATAAEAALSCLAQQGPALDIVLSDDASTDGTAGVLHAVAQAYSGPHRVRVNLNPRNLGIAAHVNCLAELAHGGLIILAAGDDVSLPERAVHVRQAWEASGRRLDLIAAPLIDLDAEGREHGVIAVDDLSHWRGAADWAARRPHVIGAGHAWTRRLFERFGPLDPAIAYEDQVLAFRAIVGAGAVTLDTPLVRYRRGGTSARPQQAAQRRLRLAVQTRRHLAGVRQLLRDAATAGVAPLVEKALQHELARHEYVQALLDAQNWPARCGIALHAGQVDFGWRWRKFWATVRP
jgi:hypothetical protein